MVFRGFWKGSSRVQLVRTRWNWDRLKITSNCSNGATINEKIRLTQKNCGKGFPGVQLDGIETGWNLLQVKAIGLRCMKEHVLRRIFGGKGCPQAFERGGVERPPLVLTRRDWDSLKTNLNCSDGYTIKGKKRLTRNFCIRGLQWVSKVGVPTSHD